MGQLGPGELPEENAPVRVPLAAPAVEIDAGASHTCARLSDERVVCWGADVEAQLGVRPAWWIDGPVEVPIPARAQARTTPPSWAGATS